MRCCPDGYPNGYPGDDASCQYWFMSGVEQRGKGTGSIYLNARGQWVAAFEAGWSEHGKRRRITLKARTEVGARARLAEAQQLLAAEGPSTSFGSRLTVKRWADLWLDERQRIVRPGTYIADRSGVMRWIVPSIGHIQLESLVPADIRKVANAQEDAGLSLATMQRTHAVLTKLLTDAVAEGYRVPQRAREASRPISARSSRKALGVEAATKILTAALTRTNSTRWVAALLQGLRPAEALGLTWDMVDLDQETMTLAWQLKALPYVEARNPDSGFRVPRGFESRRIHGAYHLVRPKTNAGERVVPLIPWMVKALTEWKESAPRSPHGLVWPRDDGRPQTAADDRQEWYDLVDAADVTVTLDDGSQRRPLLYEARHTAATLLLANGVDETTIKSILGHSSVLSTQSYLHADQSRSRAALLASAVSMGLGR